MTSPLDAWAVTFYLTGELASFALWILDHNREPTLHQKLLFYEEVLTFFITLF